MHQYPDVDSDYFALPQWQRDLIWTLAGPALLNTPWAPASLPVPGLLPAGSTSADTGSKSPANPCTLANTAATHRFDPALLTQVQELSQPQECRSPRLGLVFEHLWQHWLAQSHLRWSANIQIKDQGRTLGELDLLVDDGQDHWHLELAIKFYLNCQRDWIGPNRRDRLADKIRHTRDHQLPLSQQQAAIESLKASDWRPSKRLAITRGCLFYPHDYSHDPKTGIATRSASDLTPESVNGPTLKKSVGTPIEVNPTHWRGQWMHAQYLSQLPQGRWYLLAKDQWLSPALVSQPVDNAYLQKYLNAHFNHLRTPVCLVRTEQGRHGWAEQERWFVMPDGWPSAINRS